MRRDIPVEEMADFLELPTVSVLATYRREGGVLLSPVWHRWRDGGFDVMCFPGDIKLRHLERDPRASLLVHEQVPPYRGVEIRTTPVVSELENAPAVLREMAARYLGEDGADAYAATVPDALVLVRLEPGHVRTWDFAGDF
jgi:PPOX class probable F420-dependent enzyme